MDIKKQNVPNQPLSEAELEQVNGGQSTSNKTYACYICGQVFDDYHVYCRHLGAVHNIKRTAGIC